MKAGYRLVYGGSTAPASCAWVREVRGLAL